MPIACRSRRVLPIPACTAPLPASRRWWRGQTSTRRCCRSPASPEAPEAKIDRNRPRTKTVDERMIISFIEEVQYTHRPINGHVLFSPDKPEKLQKIAEPLKKFWRDCLKSQANCNKSQWPSNALDEGVDHLLLPCLVEIDGELVAVDMGHPAIAEFLVEHAHADLEPHTFRGARRDQRAVDGD